MASGIKRGLEEAALPPQARASLEGSSLEERLTALESEFLGLPEGQLDYQLVMRVQSVREEYLTSNVTYRLTQAVASFFVNTTSTRIEALYSRILQRHNLPHEYYHQHYLLVEQALANRDFNRLILFNRYMDPYMRSKSVIAAAGGGHLGIVQALLVDHENLRGEAVRAAAGGGHLEIVQALLVDRENLRSEAVTAAAGGGHLGIVQALLANGDISEDARSWAVEAAAGGGHLGVLEALLANGPIYQYLRSQAVEDAARGGHLGIVQALLANGIINELHRSQAVEDAARGGHLGIVQALLANGDISEDHRSSAVIVAARGGHLGVVQALLANGDISEDARSHAVWGAAGGGHLGVVQALLANGIINELHRSFAVRAAAGGGHLGVVQALLVDHENLRGSAVIVAARGGHLGVVQALLANGAISEDYRSWAVQDAARRGHLEIVQALLANGDISEDARDFALDQASGPNQEAIKVLLRGARILTLTRFLDPRLIQERALGLLAQDDEDIRIPAGISFDTIYEWARQIEWENRESLFYMGPQRDPDGGEVNQGNLIGLIQTALDRVTRRAAVAGAPPEGSRELGIFYDKLEYKIKSYMQKLLEDEAKLNEKIVGRSYEDLEESEKRELRFLCEAKARFCIQLGISGQHCPVRLNNEVSQLWGELFAAVSSEDELLSLEDYLKKLFGLARLKIAKEEIALIDLDTHIFGAYMESLGVAFHIPGAKNEIEHLTKFSKEQKASLAQRFANKYTQAYLVQEMQNFYKEPTRQAFREKIQTWLQENVGEWNQDEYNRVFADLQGSIATKLQELESSKIACHRATDLFLDILRAIDPTATLELEHGETVSLAELSQRLSQKKLTLDEFKRCVLNCEIAKNKIAASGFMQPRQNPAFVKAAFLTELNDLGCDNALEKLVIFQAIKDQALADQAIEELQEALTLNNRIREIQKLSAAHGLTGVDCHKFQDKEAFERSLKAAIVNKQKSDYLERCLGEAELLELPSPVAESILVGLGFLRSA